MKNRPKTLAIIPARSGSKGIIDKNITPFLGLPLLAHSILAAKNSKICDEILLATDSTHYAEIGKKYGANTPYLRKKANATDNAPTINLILEAISFYKQENFEVMILLQPTSPLRDASDIINAYKLFLDSNMQGLLSLSPAHSHPLLLRSMQDNTTQKLLDMPSSVRRQDMPPFYEVNGAIYINAIKDISPATSLNDNPIGYIMDIHKSIDIDTPLDLAIANLLASNHF